jgi:hypothetical protein
MFPRRFRTLSLAPNGAVMRDAAGVGSGGGLKRVDEDVAGVESLLRCELGCE